MNIAQLISNFVSPKVERVLSGPRVKLYWWAGRPNVGDAISPLLVSGVSGREVYDAKKREHPKLLAVGSLMHYARAGDVIWGTGCISEETRIKTNKLLACAVRGPRTRAVLLKHGVECPEVYGDPAILLPRFISPNAVSKTHSLGVVPHFMDHDDITIDDPMVKKISVDLPAEDFVRELLSCERIVSSSLHGIIIAEAYGIPADWLKISKRLIGENFKFNDYFEGTERDAIAPLTLDTMYKERDIATAKHNTNGLLGAFPVSLM